MTCYALEFAAVLLPVVNETKRQCKKKLQMPSAGGTARGGSGIASAWPVVSSFLRGRASERRPVDTTHSPLMTSPLWAPGSDQRSPARSTRAVAATLAPVTGWKALAFRSRRASSTAPAGKMPSGNRQKCRPCAAPVARAIPWLTLQLAGGAPLRDESRCPGGQRHGEIWEARRRSPPPRRQRRRARRCTHRRSRHTTRPAQRARRAAAGARVAAGAAAVWAPAATAARRGRRRRTSPR